MKLHSGAAYLPLLLPILIAGCSSATPAGPASPPSHVPAGYQGRPFSDEFHATGAAIIPGRLECACYDLGGEGIAYHDTDAVNHGSGELNLQPRHQRPDSSPYTWHFRANEGVDVSYTKDFADLNHPNLVAPEENQLYIGWAADGEWCNYTTNVRKPGTYKIVALYANAANEVEFVVDGQAVTKARLPVATGSMHRWNKAEIGRIVFQESGLHLLTFRYNAGNNFAYFDFEFIGP